MENRDDGTAVRQKDNDEPRSLLWAMQQSDDLV